MKKMEGGWKGEGGWDTAALLVIADFCHFAGACGINCPPMYVEMYQRQRELTIPQINWC